MREQLILTRLITRLTNRALMVNHYDLFSIVGVAADAIRLESSDILSRPPKDAASVSNGMSGIGKIAVVPIHGILLKRDAGFWAAIFGLGSYEAIGKNFRSAMNDPAISAIVFDIDSPGGEAAGVFDLTDEIYEARGKKPMIAIANESAFSAAYSIASAADKIYLPRTGMLGSIGVRALHIDQSGFDAHLGVKYTYVYRGERKIDYNQHSPMSPKAHTALQAEIDELYDLFIQTVARNRDIDAEKVSGTESANYQGANAIDAGLADGVMNWDQVINEIISDIGGKKMDAIEIKTQLEAILNDTETDAAAILAEMGYLKPTQEETGEEISIDVEAIRQDARNEGVEEAMTRILGIIDLCNLAEMPQMAKELIRKGATVEEARTKILAAKANKGKDDEIISIVDPMNMGETNPVLEDAKRRAQAAANKK